MSRLKKKGEFLYDGDVIVGIKSNEIYKASIGKWSRESGVENEEILTAREDITIDGILAVRSGSKYTIGKIGNKYYWIELKEEAGNE